MQGLAKRQTHTDIRFLKSQSSVKGSFKILLNCWWLVAYGHEFENHLLAFVGILDPRNVETSTLSRPKGASDEEVAPFG